MGSMKSLEGWALYLVAQMSLLTVESDSEFLSLCAEVEVH